MGSNSTAVPKAPQSPGLPPWPLFTLGTAAAKWAYGLPNSIIPPAPRVLDITYAFAQSQVLYTVSKLDIAEALAKGPLTCKELAPIVGADPEKLFRLLRLAVTYGIVDVAVASIEEDSKFSNNALTQQLLPDAPVSMKYYVHHIMEMCYPAWGNLVHAVKHGEDEDTNGWIMHAGKPAFDWLSEHPAEQEDFSRAMTSADALGLPGVLADYNWGQYKRFVDIGGAHGSVLAGLMAQHLSVPGVLFDMPEVITQAEDIWEKQHGDLRSRTTLVGGDFFKAETLPKAQDGDAFVMRWILHDWSDKDAARILRGLRQAIGTASAKIVIVETMPSLTPKMTINNLMDMHMLVMLNGKERSEQQWRSLFESTGFKFVKALPTRGAHVIIEAVPV